MSLMSYLKGRLANEDGSVAIETLLMVPLMAWAMLATLTYFDAYRSESISHRAGLTIADMFSRETDYIDPGYIDGAHLLLKTQVISDNDPDFRVTVFTFDGPGNSYDLVWSQHRGSRIALTQAQIAALSARLPIMSNGERAILVETWAHYVPPWSVGIGAFDMATFDVISPRFAPQLCWNTTPGQGNLTAVC